MPKKRAASSDSDSDSGPDDREPEKKAPEKKAKSEKKGSSSNDNEQSFDLDKKKRVTVREFRGVVYVDIREFYEQDGEMKPGKKGISLTVSAWNKLKDLISDIDEAVSKH